MVRIVIEPCGYMWYFHITCFDDIKRNARYVAQSNSNWRLRCLEGNSKVKDKKYYFYVKKIVSLHHYSYQT